MGLFTTVELGGKRIPAYKFEEMLDRACDNIIMSGFSSSEQLKTALLTNCNRSNVMAIQILNKLITVYNDRLQKESDICYNDAAACCNILEVSAKIKMIYTVLDDIVKLTRNALQQGDNRYGKLAIMMESESEDYDDEPDPEELNEDEDEDEDNEEEYDEEDYSDEIDNLFSKMADSANSLVHGARKYSMN